MKLEEAEGNEVRVAKQLGNIGLVYMNLSDFSKALEYNIDDIIQDEGIYQNGKSQIISIVRSLDNSLDNVMFFGHNPDITSLSSYFSGQFFDNMPTCGTICIDFESTDWNEVIQINGKIRFLEFPKKYSKKERFEIID